MKVAYLGKIQLSDVDLSYLHEAERLSDITYILEVTPRYLKGPAFNIEKIYPKSGLFKATEAYPEFSRLAGFVNLDHFYVLNTCGRLWQLKAFWTNFLLLLFLVRQKFGAIHWAWPPNVYEFPIYFLRKRMLLTVHDPFPHTAHDSFIVRLRRKMAFWLIPRLIILNKAQREDFINFYHIDPRRIIDSQLSCYTYLQCVKPDTAAAPTSRYLLFAGRISPYKGLDYLLPAMEKIHAELPDCKLIVAGGGKYHFDIAKYQAADYIDIRNRYIPDEELVALISNCAFMVCPYTDATQSGVIMSAYAFNKPVIASNVGGLPEMVKHNHYGLVIKEKDVDALADSIATLWKDPTLLENFSRQIENDYTHGDLSWTEIAQKLCHAYSETGQK